MFHKISLSLACNSLPEEVAYSGPATIGCSEVNNLTLHVMPHTIPKHEFFFFFFFTSHSLERFSVTIIIQEKES